jgi:exopolyphosphatase/guanosine-5'-triphosphate,3'-diphosphate pyrophosphatase
MQAVFDEFRIESMAYCDSALREGILYDLLGRASGTDRREITISHLVERYRMDDRHGRHVAAAAGALLTALQGGSPDPHQLQMLAWAARISEIGSFIAHADAHKHGGYIVAHADLPGFSGAEQRLLSFLVLGQSGGLRKMRAHNPEAAHWLLLLCLRIAVILQRRRDGRPTPIRIHPAASNPTAGWRIELEQQWAAEHPLTNQSLHKEVEQWRDSGLFKQVGYILT